MIEELAYLIKADLYGADVGRTDSREREEAVSPAACVHSAFIEAEKSLQPARYAWVNTEQLTYITRNQPINL